MPSISVLMSIYKEPEAWLRESIDSILNQSFGDFEFIIVNDFPDRDLNCRLLNEYAQNDKRIKIIQNPQNLGLTKSLNIGLRESTGKYVARQDADDISVKNRFRVQFDYMEKNKDCIVCGSNMYNFFNNQKNKKLIKFPEKDEDIKLYMFFKNPISHPTVFLRNDFLKKNKIFYNESEKATYAEDMVLWTEISSRAVFYNIQSPTVYHRISLQQITIRKKKQSNKVLYFAIQTYYQNNKNYNPKRFKERVFYKAAFYQNKQSQISLIDIFKVIFSPVIFYPKLLYYLLKKMKWSKKM